QHPSNTLIDFPPRWLFSWNAECVPARTGHSSMGLSSLVHVFDHFHVVKLCNEKLSDFRRELQREAEDKMGKKVLKGTRWLLLKNPENLDPKKKERERLEEALCMNQPLATVYYMKADLRQIWGQADKAAATRMLEDWIRRAEASCLKVLQKFAATLAMHR